MYNKLLERQLKRNLKLGVVPSELREFLQVINQSYEHYERDHILNQHSLNISSKELAEKEKRIRSIIDAASDGIIVMDSRGKIQTCNLAFANLLLKSEGEIVSHQAVEFLKLSNHGQEETLTLEKLVKNAISWDQEFFVRRPDGKEIPLEIKISQSLISNEIVYVMVLRDVTRKKMREQEILKLHQELIVASRFAGMGEVANSLLHNMGNILNSVKISINLLIEKNKEHRIDELSQVVSLLKNNFANLESFLKDDSVGKMIPDFLTEYVLNITEESKAISVELEALKNRIDHISDIILTQQSLGKMNTVIEDVNINKLLDEALKLTFIEKFKIPVVKDYGQVYIIQSDKIKILQIVVNIIKNAIEALTNCNNADKLLSIKTYVIDENFIGIEISDTGAGISPENLDKLFAIGFTTKEEGHGIGLHSCALLILNLGGQIKVLSKGSGKGTTFYLTLPKETKTY